MEILNIVHNLVFSVGMIAVVFLMMKRESIGILLLLFWSIKAYRANFTIEGPLQSALSILVVVLLCVIVVLLNRAAERRAL